MHAQVSGTPLNKALTRPSDDHVFASLGSVLEDAVKNKRQDFVDFDFWWGSLCDEFSDDFDIPSRRALHIRCDLIDSVRSVETFVEAVLRLPGKEVGDRLASVPGELAAILESQRASLGQKYEFLEDMGHRYSPRVELLRRAFGTLLLEDKERAPQYLHEWLPIVEPRQFYRLVSQIWRDGQPRAFEAYRRAETLFQKRYNSGKRLVDAVLKAHSTVLVVRGDLFYRPQPVFKDCPDQLKTDLQRMFNHMRSRTKFKPLLGYLWRIDERPDGGSRAHVALFFDSKNSGFYIDMAREIEQFWSESVTMRDGFFRAGARSRAVVKKAAEGRHDTADEKFKDALYKAVLPYFALTGILFQEKGREKELTGSSERMRRFGASPYRERS